MKIYQVGGSLRDELLGLPVADRDWMVVGATPQGMVAAGYLPVGRDFPVFLHPKTREEYALARTERKTAPGYTGFVFHSSPDVTLEQDLARRDFTVNAMARAAVPDPDAAILIDPFDGRGDLDRRVLRHVGLAFAEDPVRILRGARFVARFGFGVAPETLALMRGMVKAGEVDALVPERIWQELARGLVERDPVAMFAMLDAVGALSRIAPELAPWRRDGVAMRSLDAAARSSLSVGQCFAATLSGLDADAASRICMRLKVPADCRDMALLLVRWRVEMAAAADLDARGLAELVHGADGLRQPERFRALIAVAGACVTGAGGRFDLAEQRLHLALAAVRGIDAGAIARNHATPADIQAALRRAREAAVARALAAPGSATADS